MHTALSAEIKAAVKEAVALSAEIKAAVKEAVAEISRRYQARLLRPELRQGWDIGQTSVRAEIKAGRLKARQLGDRLIIPATEAHAFLSRLPEPLAA